MKELAAHALKSIPNPQSGKTVEKECYCGKRFTVPNGTEQIYAKECPDCLKQRQRRWEEEQEAEKRKEREEEWRHLCPLAYQQTDVSKLPNRDAFNKVMAWKYGPSGLILHGKTGRAKSRAAWALLEQYVKNGKKVKVLDSKSGIHYAALFSVTPEKAEKWLNDAIGADLILLDDIFKVKLTDSFECAVFTLIDQRMANLKPMIVTTNDTGESLSSRMSEDRGAALLRRIRESCEAIKF